MRAFQARGAIMAEFVLRMEGVDFDATAFDTHNLSAYRGGSLALLDAPKAVRGFLEASDALKEEIFAAASQGAWIIEAKDDGGAGFQ